MGTGPFAAPALRALIAANYDIVGVYTKPLPTQRRSRTTVAQNPVRTAAQEHDIFIYDPAEKLSAPGTFAELSTLAPDLIVVAAYGKILPRDVLLLPRYGCINIHASLLPQWRGAAPIHNAIRAGDTVTGVTIMRMDEGIDTGPIITQSSREIAPDMHTPELFGALADDGAQLLIDTLPDYIDETILPKPQPAEGVTLCRTLSRDEGALDFTQDTQTLYNQFRGLDPWPGTFACWTTDTSCVRIKLLEITPTKMTHADAPGTVFTQDKNLYIATADGALCVTRLQIEGKKPMSAADVLNGYQQLIGATLTHA